MKILIDNGHGIDTKGKRSPDGRLLEYLENRIIAQGIVDALTARGLDASLLVPEETDISLPERCRRVNEWCRQLGKDNVLLISIHCNAAGRGDRWLSARGWCAYTTRGNTRADALATSLYTAAQAHLPGHCLRTDYTDRTSFHRKSHRHFTTNVTAKLPQILPSVFAEIFGRVPQNA